MAVKTYSYVFEDLAVVLEVVVTREVVGVLLRFGFSLFRHVCLAL